MTSKNQDSRCQGQTKAGKPCRAAATSGGLCFFHSNPNKAAELGRICGRKKSRPLADASDPLPKLDKITAVRDAMEKLIADVLAGKLHPRLAASLAPLFSLQLRAVEAVEAVEAVVLVGGASSRRSRPPAATMRRRSKSVNIGAT